MVIIIEGPRLNLLPVILRLTLFPTDNHSPIIIKRRTLQLKNSITKIINIKNNFNKLFRTVLRP